MSREYVNRMIYHAISSDPEALVPEWTFKVGAHLSTQLIKDHSNNSDSRCDNPELGITDNGRKFRCNHGSYQDSSLGLYRNPRSSYLDKGRARTGFHDKDILRGDFDRT